jgi:hypothetical protein
MSEEASCSVTWEEDGCNDISNTSLGSIYCDLSPSTTSYDSSSASSASSAFEDSIILSRNNSTNKLDNSSSSSNTTTTTQKSKISNNSNNSSNINKSNNQINLRVASVDHPHTLNNKSLFTYYFYTNTNTVLNKFVMSYEEQLHKAIVKANVELCCELIEQRHCDVNTMANKRLPLGLACEYNNLQITQLLIEV